MDKSEFNVVNDARLLEEISLEEVKKYVDYHNHNITHVEKKDIDFDIVKIFGALSEGTNAPLFALVDWNGYLRYDVRRWKNKHTIPGKGMVFDSEELNLLANCNWNMLPVNSPVLAEYSNGSANARIYQSVCVLSRFKRKGMDWKKEITITDWGYGRKIDLRKWSDNYEKCSRGICLTYDEFKSFMDMVMRMFT